MRLAHACQPAAWVFRGTHCVSSRGRRKAADFGIRAKAFVPLTGRELLSLAWPRESNQREGHPADAPSGHPALRVRGWATGFFDGTSMYRRKTGRPPAGHPADFPSPTRRVRGAPGGAARSCAQKQQSEQSEAAQSRANMRVASTPFPPSLGLGERVGVRGVSAIAHALAVASGAHDARLLFRGPWAAVRRGRPGRAAGEATDGLAFSRGQEPARKARPRLTHLPGRTPGKRQPGWPFSLVTFSLATQRESNSGRGSGSKPLCRFRKLEKSKSPLSPNPSPASGRGEQSPPTEAGRWWPPLGSPAIHHRMRTMLVM